MSLEMGWAFGCHFVKRWQYLNFAKPKQDVKIYHFVTLQEMKLTALPTDQE